MNSETLTDSQAAPAVGFHFFYLSAVVFHAHAIWKARYLKTAIINASKGKKRRNELYMGGIPHLDLCKNMPELEPLRGKNPLLLFLPRPELGTESSLSSGHLWTLYFTHFQLMKGKGLGPRIGAVSVRSSSPSRAV